MTTNPATGGLLAHPEVEGELDRTLPALDGRCSSWIAAGDKAGEEKREDRRSVLFIARLASGAGGAIRCERDAIEVDGDNVADIAGTLGPELGSTI